MALAVWAVAMAASEVWALATAVATVAMDTAATAHAAMEDTGHPAATEKENLHATDDFWQSICLPIPPSGRFTPPTSLRR